MDKQKQLVFTEGHGGYARNDLECVEAVGRGELYRVRADE